jgi:propanol-preferring alcohol dehydrogenase
MARAGGHVAIVGLAGGRLPVGFGATPLETKIVIPYWGTQGELMEVLALRASDRISPQIEWFSLHDVDDGRNARRGPAKDARS